MRAKGRIDRQKHEVDVTEHVLGGGVRAEAPGPPGARVVGLDVSVSPGPLGLVASAVQVQVLPDEEPVTGLPGLRRPADDRKR